MKSLRTIITEIESPERFRNVDVLRGLAILLVLLRHTNLNFFYYGGLGVDLFLVISGFLVSKPLLRAIQAGENISFRDFVARRAVRILPSYYVFLGLAGPVSFLLYHQTHPDYVLPFKQLPRFIFFIFNYFPINNFIFTHVWSLCVEEHFYLLLPLAFLFFQNKPPRQLVKILLLAMGGTLLLKVGFFLYNRSFLFSATHGRLDALLLGVLARYGFEYGRLGRFQKNVWLVIAGLILLTLAIIGDYTIPRGFYAAVGFHFLVPLAMTMLLIGSLGSQMRGSLPLRLLSYFTYNLYLWHLLFSALIFDQLGRGWLGISTYFGVALFLAVLANQTVEGPGLKLRHLKWPRLVLQKNRIALDNNGVAL